MSEDQQREYNEQAVHTANERKAKVVVAVAAVAAKNAVPARVDNPEAQAHPAGHSEAIVVYTGTANVPYTPACELVTWYASAEKLPESGELSILVNPQLVAN